MIRKLFFIWFSIFYWSLIMIFVWKCCFICFFILEFISYIINMISSLFFSWCCCILRWKLYYWISLIWLISRNDDDDDIDIVWIYILVMMIVIISLSDFSRWLKCSSISFEYIICYIMKYRISLTFLSISSKILKNISIIIMILSSSWFILLYIT